MAARISDRISGSTLANDEAIQAYEADGVTLVELVKVNASDQISIAADGQDVVIGGTVNARNIATDGAKLDGIATGANNYTLPAGYATETYVGTQISNLVDSSPAALNTLNELAAAIGDDANFSTTVTNNIATKLPLAGGTLTGNLGVSGRITQTVANGDSVMSVITNNTNSSSVLGLTAESGGAYAMTMSVQGAGVGSKGLSFRKDGFTGTEVMFLDYTNPGVDVSGNLSTYGETVLQDGATGYNALRLRRVANANGSGVKLMFTMQNSASEDIDYASITPIIASNTDGNESSYIAFATMKDGANSNAFRIGHETVEVLAGHNFSVAGNIIAPAIGLGTSTLANSSTVWQHQVQADQYAFSRYDSTGTSGSNASGIQLRNEGSHVGGIQYAESTGRTFLTGPDGGQSIYMEAGSTTVGTNLDVTGGVTASKLATSSGTPAAGAAGFSLYASGSYGGGLGFRDGSIDHGIWLQSGVARFAKGAANANLTAAANVYLDIDASNNATFYNNVTVGGTITGTLSGNATTATSATNAVRFQSTSHNGTYHLVNNWDNQYWYITSNHSGGTRVDVADNLTAGSKAIAGNLTVGNTTNSNIYMTDTDEGYRTIHCNSHRIGFLTQVGHWSAYSTDAGRWTCEAGLTVNNGIVNNNPGINYVGTTVTGGTSNMIGFRWIGGPNTVNVGVDNVVNIVVGTASDYRLKIVTTNDIGDSLSRLKSLNTYEYTSKDEDTGTVYRGVLAHEVAKLFPNLAQGAKDDPDQLQSVDHAAFTIELIQAMKQLDARLTAIEAHLNIEAAELVIPDYEPVASPDFVFPVLTEPEAVPTKE